MERIKKFSLPLLSVFFLFSKGKIICPCFPGKSENIRFYSFVMDDVFGTWMDSILLG